MIKELPVNGFDAKLDNSGNNYPQAKNPNLPRLFMNGLFVASRNSGKTHCCVKLLKEFENSHLIDDDNIVHPQRTFLISPTAQANKIFDNLKTLDENDVHLEYNDEIFQGIINEIEKTNEEVKNFKEYKEAYELIKRTPKKGIIKLISEQPEIITILSQYEYQDPDDIDIKYKERPVNFIVLDDLMSSSAFSKKTENLLTYYLIRNRHHFISFMILIQSLKACSPAIRLNCNYYFLGKFASKDYILQQIHPEISNVCTESQLDELYTHATQDKYGALIIDTSGDTKKFYKSLDKELIIE